MASRMCCTSAPGRSSGRWVGQYRRVTSGGAPCAASHPARPRDLWTSTAASQGNRKAILAVCARRPVAGRDPKVMGGAMQQHNPVRVRGNKGAEVQRNRRRPVLLAVVVLLFGGLLAAMPLTASTAATTNPAVSPTTDPANGFPMWYQDSTGTRIQPCLDANDANCGVAADPGFDPTKPEVFPTNFPSEFFYSTVQSDKIATPGCKGAKPGRISILDALEGAFVNGAPKFGDQMVFGRERLILTGGLCPKSPYQVTAPYGNFSFTTDDKGALARNQGTTDIGCAPLAPNVCDFSIALTSPQAKNFLRWDPAVAPQAPSGYLGDGATLHPIVGGTNGNLFRVTGPGANNNSPVNLSTNLFTV